MIQATDYRGHRLSSANQTAVDACNAGVESYIQSRVDAMANLDSAIEADNSFALPKLVKAWMLHASRNTAVANTIQSLVDDVEACIDVSNNRDRDYLAALQDARCGRGTEAATVLEALLDRYPTDLLGHRLVQYELFWNGRASWMREIIERAAPRWSDNVAGYSAFLAARAFSNEEAGCYAEAERYALQAIEIDDASIWGAHTIAHVHLMQGRFDEGATWLENLSGNWAAANQMRHHLWWHLCLFLLERGENHRILELLTTEIRNPDSPLVKAAPDATIDLQNVASILLRLELRGVDVVNQWPIIAEACAGRVHNHTNALGNAHDMMVLAATGQMDQAESLMQSMREYAEIGDGSLRTSYLAAGIATCAAVLAHRRRDYTGVIETLSPVRHDLPLLGGSHAQRDIFYQILIDAAQRLGRAELVLIYLRDIRRIGFDRLAERGLYRDAAGATNLERNIANAAEPSGRDHIEANREEISRDDQ